MLKKFYPWYAHNSLIAPSFGAPIYTRTSSCWRKSEDRQLNSYWTTTLLTINLVYFHSNCSLWWCSLSSMTSSSLSNRSTVSPAVLTFWTMSLSVNRSSTHHKLKQSVSCTNKTNHFYFNRLPRLWNSLPCNCQPQSTFVYHNLRVETIFLELFYHKLWPSQAMYASLPVSLLQMLCITLYQLFST